MDDKPQEESSSIKSSILDRFRQMNEEIEAEKLKKQEDLPKESSYKTVFHSKKRRYEEVDEIQVGLKERDVGMDAFLSDLKGFDGIIKHRISDFQVHEVDKEGNVVELTSFDVPVVESEENPFDENILTEEQKAALDQLVKSEVKEKKTYEIDVDNASKDMRTAYHKAIKQIYQNKLFTSTKLIGEGGSAKTVIVVGRVQNKQDRFAWPKSLGHFLHFTLYKDNLDTNTVINTIAQNLRLRPNQISFAGLKDKRGKTTQRMCIKLRTADQLIRVRRSLPKCSFGNFIYKIKPLRLGDLSGNRFSLVIRNITVENEELVKGIMHLQEFGFINYFGLQRFGTSILAPTYSVGKQLLLSNWKEAVNLILKPRYKEFASEQMKKCREVWEETRSAVASLKCLRPKDTSVEAQILRSLKTQGNEQYFNALFSLPRNSMLLYLHSYQSLIWNKIVSKRIKNFGYKAIKGDLIVISDEKNEDIEGNKIENEDDDNEEDENEKTTETTFKQIKVKKLTEEEAQTTNFSEVVYPLPGNDVDFPDNKIAEWYHEILSEDGVTMEHFEKSNKSFALYGAYRKAVQIPSNLTYEIINHSDQNEDFILSDLDKMLKRTLKNSEGGDLKSLILHFTLKSSTYATMLLRELMKSDTAVSTHANLSREFKKQKKGTENSI